MSIYFFFILVLTDLLHVSFGFSFTSIWSPLSKANLGNIVLIWWHSDDVSNPGPSSFFDVSLMDGVEVFQCNSTFEVLSDKNIILFKIIKTHLFWKTSNI